jgi:hypothetical protein
VYAGGGRRFFSGVVGRGGQLCVCLQPVVSLFGVYFELRKRCGCGPHACVPGCGDVLCWCSSVEQLGVRVCVENTVVLRLCAECVCVLSLQYVHKYIPACAKCWSVVCANP